MSTRGKALAGVVCNCASCREAGRRFAANSPNGCVLDADGGTAVVLYRKDRVHCLRGGEHLSELRSQPASKTKRVVATCCGTPMFLDFEPGFWMSIYRKRLGDRSPAITLKAHTGRFMLKLLAAWVAMGLQSPKFEWGRG
jgi:hypothetical protein